MLLVLILLPIFTIGYILFNNKLTKEEILYVSLFSSVISLIQTFIIFENFDITTTRFQFLTFNGLLGIDSISLLLIWLINILLPIIILNLYPKELNKNQIVLFLFLSLFCIIVFLVLDLILFYIFYEVLLIPMLYLIGYYGSRNRKIQALYEFYIYTLVGSLLLLVSFIILFIESGTTSYEILTT
jgi:NADH-ubiquinone oxidoreductase chain 4